MAHVFSGRPDPTWEVDASLGERLERLWEQLQPLSGAEAPGPPPLGYRGASLQGPDGRPWLAFDAVVIRGEERRLDPERQFERELLGSAPEGLLPREVIATSQG